MNQLSLTEMKELATLFAQSRLFGDLQSLAAAFVKIQAGSELGFGPYASMTSFDIVKGKCELNANAQATLLKRSGRYDYKILELTNDACEIEFLEVAGEAGRSLGKSRFTIADAQRAQISSDMYRKYPRNMLFSRAMTNGVAWYCPDAIGLRVYGEGELPGAERSTEAPDASQANVERLAAGQIIEAKGGVLPVFDTETIHGDPRNHPLPDYETVMAEPYEKAEEKTFAEKLDKKHAALVNDIPAASLKGKKGTSPEEIAKKLNAAIAERSKTTPNAKPWSHAELAKAAEGAPPSDYEPPVKGWDADGHPVHPEDLMPSAAVVGVDEADEPMKLTKAEGLSYVDRVLMQIGRLVPKQNFSNGVRRGHICDALFEAFQYQPKPEDLDRLAEVLKTFDLERLKTGLAKLEKMEPKT